jgi:hypothetical protein
MELHVVYSIEKVKECQKSIFYPFFQKQFGKKSKKYIFDIFVLFLVFSTSFQKN